MAQARVGDRGADLDPGRGLRQGPRQRREILRVVALPDPRRAEVYATQAGRYPGFAGYQEKTSRPIPVIALTLQR